MKYEIKPKFSDIAVLVMWFVLSGLVSMESVSQDFYYAVTVGVLGFFGVKVGVRAIYELGYKIAKQEE